MSPPPPQSSDQFAASTVGSDAIGNLASLAEGEILLPPFVSRSAGGICIDARNAGSAGVIAQFIDRVYASGAYFVDLDYGTLSALLYPRNASGDIAPPPLPAAPQRIAAAIRRLDPERKALYKNVKITDGCVEYIFEPVAIERIVEKPIYGETDAEGNPVQTGTDREVILEPAKLDADEFVAAMWQKEVRYGLDIGAIRAAIAATGAQRVTIARQTESKPGEDATLAEQTSALHRDDSPHILPNGKIDLNQFKNRFPQITAGEALLKKVARRFGLLGFEIDGTPIEPAIAKDFDINDLAGPGTRVERRADGEYVVAATDGFLNIDVASHQISITAKIINRDGISLRTTGDLSLTGAEFEEHGEVQERRVVEGKHMSFHADVFGEISSQGGRVHLLAGLAGGKIRNSGGSVQIDKRAAQAVIEARDGTVAITQAENSVIIAGKITIARAMGCDIVGDDIEIEEALACTVVGRRVRIAKAGARRNIDTLVSLCLPDLSSLDKAIAETRAEIKRLAEEAAMQQKTLDALAATPELRNFLAIEARIRTGTVKLNDAQQTQWRAAAQKLAKPLQDMRGLREAGVRLAAKQSACAAQLADLQKQRAEAGTDIRCEIAEINGDVVVRTVKVPPFGPLFPTLQASETKHKLRDGRDTVTRLFSGDAGEFSWAFASTTQTEPPQE